MNLPGLLQAAVTAKHVEVFDNGFAAGVPRCNMVGVQLLVLKALFADRANTLLLFVDGVPVILLELPQAEKYLFLT